MIRILEQAAKVHGLPERIVVDNGPEFKSRAMQRWAKDRDLELHFIEPGKPTQNAFIKSFGARLRHECLNEHVFSNVQEGQSTLEQWRRDYHQERPHRSLGGQTPNEFAEGLTRAVGELGGQIRSTGRYISIRTSSTEGSQRL